MKMQGGLGGIFAYATYTASTISFHENTPSADTIEDSASGFLTAGFVVGMTVTITDTASNNKNVTIAALTASVITLLSTDDLTDEAEGSATIATPTYGYQVLGFKQWSGSNGIELVDSTCFENYPFRTHKTTLKDWSATFDGFWLSTERDSWLGRKLHLRLFQRFALSPSATDPAVYWSGDATVTDIPISAPLDTLVNESITVAGNGVLTPTLKTTSW
jgi:uncharacterized membrane protein